MKSLTPILLLILLLSPFNTQAGTQPIRNIAFIGSTGNGKSTACNILYSGSTNIPFPVGHSASGETEKVVGHVSRSKNIRVIDTPGFGDNRFDEKHIDSIIRQFTEVILSREENVSASPSIDAFVLVTRLTPRASTLKNDLEHVRDLFGTIALKSLILLVVYNDGVEGDSKSFMKDLKEMKEVTSILEQGKGEKPNENWFVIFDTRRPNHRQEKELLTKIDKLEPYTHEKFIQADNEIRDRIEKNVKVAVEKTTDSIKREFKDDTETLKKKLAEITNQFEAQKAETLEERRKAKEFAQQVLSKFGPSLSKTLVGGGIGYKIGAMLGPIGGAIGGVVGGIFGNLVDL